MVAGFGKFPKDETSRCHLRTIDGRPSPARAATLTATRAIGDKHCSASTPLTWQEALDRHGAQQDASHPPPHRVASALRFRAGLGQARLLAKFSRRALSGATRHEWRVCVRLFHVCADKLAGPELIAWWFNPRDGKTCDASGRASEQSFLQLSAADRHTFHPGQVNSPSTIRSRWPAAVIRLSRSARRQRDHK